VVAGYALAVGGALVVQGVTAPLAGTILCAVLVVALLAHPVLAGDARLDLLVAVALVPLAAILAVAMPIEEVPRTLWPALVGVPVLLGIVLAARRLRLGRAALGVTPTGLRPLAWALAAGIPLGLVVYLVLRPARIEAGLGPAAVAGAALAVGVFAGALEELLLRGLVQPLLVGAVGARGIPWTAGLSAALYAGTRSVPVVLVAGGLSLVAGGVARRSGTIAAVALAHGTLAAGALVVWPAVLGAPDPAPLVRPIVRPAPVKVEVAAGVSPEIVRMRHMGTLEPLPPAAIAVDTLRARLHAPPPVVHHRHHARRHRHRARRARRRFVPVVPRRTVRPAPRVFTAPRPAPRPAPVAPRPAPAPAPRPAPPVARPPAPRPAPRPAPKPAPQPSSPSQNFDDSG
jgi:membrane protease YdiL (CAAX protease family)